MSVFLRLSRRAIIGLLLLSLCTIYPDKYLMGFEGMESGRLTKG